MADKDYKIESNSSKMTLQNKITIAVMFFSFLATVFMVLISPPMRRSVSDEVHPFCDPSGLPFGAYICYWCLLAIHFGAYLFCSLKWIYCSLKQQKLRPIRYNEAWLLAMRWIHFLYAAFLTGLIVISNYTISATVLFPLAILLWLSFFHALSRTTFRPIPCYLLSLSAVILFICFSGLPYQSENFWGLKSFAKDVYNFLDNIFNSSSDTFKTLFASSAMIAVLASTVLTAGKSMLNKIRAQAEDNTSKNTRRQLLAHWWYNPKAVIIENASICVSTGFIAACSIVLIAACNKAINDRDGGYSLIFFAAVASIFSAIGIVGLFTVRDNDLLKSEFFFLHYTALQVGQLRLGEDDSAKSSVEERLSSEEDRTALDWLRIWHDKIKIYLNRQQYIAHFTRGMFGSVNQDKAERRLRDFCQVSVNLLINGSTIRSENEVAHNISFLFENIGEVVRCKQTHGILVSELFNAYRDERAKVNLAISTSQNDDKKQPNSGTSKKTTLSQKQKASSFLTSDLLFSSILFSLINSPHARKCAPIMNINSCVQTIQTILEMPDINFFFFSGNLSANELIDLLQFDALDHIARMYIGDGCIASWQCEKNCLECRYGQARQRNKSDTIAIAHNLRLTILLYPLFILQSLYERCPEMIEREGGFGKSFRLKKVEDIIERYYKSVFDCMPETDPTKEQGVIDDHQVLEHEADLAFQLFQKYTEIKQQLPNDLQSMVESGVNSVTKNLFAPDETTQKMLEQLSDRMKDQTNMVESGVNSVTKNLFPPDETTQKMSEQLSDRMKDQTNSEIYRVLVLMISGYPFSLKENSQKQSANPPDLIMPELP